MHPFSFYEPHRYLSLIKGKSDGEISQTSSDNKSVINAIRASDAHILNLAKNIEQISLYGRVASSQNGTRVVLKLLFGDEKLSVSIFPFENRDYNTRTVSLFTEELVICLVNKIKIMNGSRWLFEKIRADASNADAGQWQLYVSAYDLEAVIANKVLSYINIDSVSIQSVLTQVNAYVASGAMQKRVDKYQGKKAVSGLKEAALKAFAHGVAIEEITDAVKECFVKSIINE